MLTIPQRVDTEQELLHKSLNKLKFDLRVCCPGIIQSFNAEKQTCTVKLALREQLNIAGELSWVEIPELLDVPIVIPGTADYFITFPITAGTECLVVFGDNCMDAWWQMGGVQNQIEKRRHDLSDGYAIIGPRSQPNVVTNYATDGVEVRNKSGDAKIKISGTTISIATSGTVNIGSGDVVINSRKFLEHTHGGVEPGGGTTGGVV